MSICLHVIYLYLTYSLSHTRTHKRTHTYTHAHTHSHTYTHTHTHTHTHTYTHTHTCTCREHNDVTAAVVQLYVVVGEAHVCYLSAPQVGPGNTLQTLQHTATHCKHCNTLRCTPMCFLLAPRVELKNTLQRNATQCNTLQHAATRCNTLQYTVLHAHVFCRHSR